MMIKKCISLQLLLCMMLLFCTPCITTVNAVEYVDATRYYYYQLSDLEQKIYDSLLEQIDGEEQITISFTNTNTVEEWEAAIDRVNRALVADQPEYSLYWYDAYLSSFGDIIVIGRVSAEGPDWLLSTVQARIDQYVASIDPNADGYSQIYELYQIMYNEVYYDDYYNLIGHNMSTIYSVYGCLGYGVSVCDGFAYSVKIICDRLSIPCLYVTGHNPGSSEGHAWNYIQMEDGQWYNFDTSARFGMPTYILGGKDCIMNEEGIKNGTMNDFVLPECSEQPYVYTGTITDNSYTLAPNTYLDAPGTFVYEVNEDGYSCTVTGYYGSQKGDLRIPEQIDGYIVTEIAPLAFYARIGFTGDIIIPDTVTTIGESAFRQCYGISGSLTLPKQLVSIGALAFLGNENMEGSLELSDSLRSIGRMAFHACKSLTGSVTLPEGITEVDFPFYDCFGLDDTLYIPDSLKTIKGLLTGTNFKALYVNDTNPNYSLYDGVLYSKDRRTMIACPTGKEGDLMIPEGVVRIAESACNGCSGLTGCLALPESLQIIEQWAFANTSFNGDLIIPDLVTEIGNYAFNSVGFDGKLKLPSGLERIEDGTFMCCKFTGLLELPNSVTYIGNHAFYQNQFAGTAIIPENVTYIGRDFAFGWYSEDAAFNCFFKGDAPEIHIAAFEGHRTTVYYPQNASGWSDVINKDYDVPEPITWLAICENHDLLEWNAYQEPTCTTEGVMRRDCSRCDYFETEAIPANGHTEVTLPGKAATCTEPGLTEGKKCSVCGMVTVAQQTIADKGHTIVTIPAKAATEKETGLTEGKKCSVCGIVTVKQEEIPALGHAHTETTIPGKTATCTESGLTEGKKCSVCGEVIVPQNTIPAKGHTWMNATCTAAKTCTVCGATSGKKADHTYDDMVDGTCNFCEVNRETVENRQVHHMFRMYNPNTGEHFYTGSEVERDNLIEAGWQYEGVGFTFPKNTGAPVHRLFQPSTGEHLYTMDEAEKDRLLAEGWNYEGVAFNSAYDTEAVQHRLHNPNEVVGAYHFTFSEEEKQNLINAGWEYQGIGWYSCWK